MLLLNYPTILNCWYFPSRSFCVSVFKLFVSVILLSDSIRISHLIFGSVSLLLNIGSALEAIPFDRQEDKIPPAIPPTKAVVG